MGTPSNHGIDNVVPIHIIYDHGTALWVGLVLTKLAYLNCRGGRGLGCGAVHVCTMEEENEPWELNLLKAYCDTDLSLETVRCVRVSAKKLNGATVLYIHTE